MGLLRFKKTEETGEAAIEIKANSKSEHSISPYLTGKFCEHLGNNIYNGMEAQILQNPTFGDWPFGAGRHPDGGLKRTSDEEWIAQQIRSRAQRTAFPDPEKLVESRSDGLAHWWIREGPGKDIRTTSDAGPHGGRAQRVEVRREGQGIGQWVYLPLHRVRSYEYRLVIRSNNLNEITIKVFPWNGDAPVFSQSHDGISRAWLSCEGTFDVPTGSCADDDGFRVVICAPKKGQFVIDRTLIYPADHVNHADPDVIRFLQESRLPILRWPGGNFVSGYHWKDGIGPVDQRPTRDNPAWGRIEPGMFGTDEFMAFCESVGCEPLICINAGNGTPQEAAEWLEYCNGAIDTPMGKCRAENGHPEPYKVKYWEVGNELPGRHQIGWTTSAGYADRFREFSEAMLERDQSIVLLANGAPTFWGNGELDGRVEGKKNALWTDEEGWNWNRLTMLENKENVQWITDHILEGGRVPPDADPMEVYRDFMAIPAVYEDWYIEVERVMRELGVKDPRLAITELQLFGKMPRVEGKKNHRLLVNPASAAECAFQRLYYHMAVRLSPFIPIITHSATVNHGGGLRKQKGRVYANPCHYGRSMFGDFAKATPCDVELACGTEKASGHLGRIPAGQEIPVLDAIAAIHEDGDLLISLVHRGIGGPVKTGVRIDGFNARATVDIVRIGAELPWDANSLDEPAKIAPVGEQVEAKNGSVRFEIGVCSVVQLRVKGKIQD